MFLSENAFVERVGTEAQRKVRRLSATFADLVRLTRLHATQYDQHQTGIHLILFSDRVRDDFSLLVLYISAINTSK